MLTAESVDELLVAAEFTALQMPAGVREQTKRRYQQIGSEPRSLVESATKEQLEAAEREADGNHNRSVV